MTHKVYIIGGPGGGKSTIARLIADKTGAPVFNLDNHFWNPDGLKSEDELRIETASITAHESWVAEGIYSETADKLIRGADVVLWIEVPLPVALWRIVGRHVRRSLAGNNPYPGVWRLIKFLRWTVRYHRADKATGTPRGTERRRNTRRYLAPYRAKVVGPRTRDVQAWLETLRLTTDGQTEPARRAKR